MRNYVSIVRYTSLSIALVCALDHAGVALAEGPGTSLEAQLDRTPLVSLEEVEQTLQLDVVGKWGLDAQYSTPLERETYMVTAEGRARKQELARERAVFKKRGLAMKTALKVSHYYTKDRSFYVETPSLGTLSAGDLHCVGEEEISDAYTCFPRAPFVWGTKRAAGVPYETMALRVPAPKTRAVEIEPRRNDLEVYLVYQPVTAREVLMGLSQSVWPHQNVFGRLRQVLLVDGDEIVHRRKL